MEGIKYKVYIKIDERNRIFRCEGGDTISNIQNPENWIFIDEGVDERHRLCQTQYFEGGLFTSDGDYRWKYENGQAMMRTAEEIEADRAENPAPEPTPDVWDELDGAYQEGYREGVDSV